MMCNVPWVSKCTERMQTTKVVSSRFMCWGLGELSGFDSTNWRPLFPRRGLDGCGGVVLVMVVLMVVLVKKMTLVPALFRFHLHLDSVENISIYSLEEGDLIRRHTWLSNGSETAVFDKQYQAITLAATTALCRLTFNDF